MTAESGVLRRLGVLGWPVAHSRSPAIQNAALKAAGLHRSWRCQLLPVPADLFAETVQALPSAGFRGANVTIPHKHMALELATSSSERARAIGAANTLLFEADGEICAENTDAPGLVAELTRHIEVRGASALVLGAGGSARAAVWALLDAGAAEVRVWNRTPERAQRLCRELGAEPVRALAGADILVNCTSVGLGVDDRLDALGLVAGKLSNYRLVADLVYRDGPAVLTHAARQAGIPTIDGLEILVAQGAESFELFTGVEPARAAMRLAAGLSSAR